MAFSNVDSLQFGKVLQIAFTSSIYKQISEDFRDWEMIKRQRVGNPDGRQLNFLLQNGLGPAAIQYRTPGVISNFPAAQSISTQECTAVYKEIDATVELPYNLWNRAQKSPAKYAAPLAQEIMSKATAAKRRLAADLYGDGTGVVGTASSAADTTGANGNVVVTLSSSNTARGHVGFFEFQDLLLPYTAAGVANNPTVTGTFYAWRVDDKDRAANTVTLRAVDSSGNVLALTASNLASTNVFYRVGQPTIPDLTSSISDYGSITEVIAGLESLAASDGRVVHGITMSGATAGTRYNASATALDVSQLQALMSNVKVAVGQSAYSYKMANMSPEALDAFITSRETDRRFNSVEDATRGTRKFVYQHQNDSIEMNSSEYCPKNRLYVLPEGKQDGAKALEFHGTDFEPVRAAGQGSEFHLKPASTGGHQRVISSYMEAMGVLIATRPAAIAVLHNFQV